MLHVDSPTKCRSVLLTRKNKIWITYLFLNYLWFVTDLSILINHITCIKKRNISPYYHEKTAPLLIIKCSLQHPSNETPFQQLRALNLYFMLNDNISSNKCPGFNVIIWWLYLYSFQCHRLDKNSKRMEQTCSEREETVLFFIQ